MSSSQPHSPRRSPGPRVSAATSRRCRSALQAHLRTMGPVGASRRPWGGLLPTPSNPDTGRDSPQASQSSRGSPGCTRHWVPCSLTGCPDTMPSFPFGITLVSREGLTRGSPCDQDTWNSPLYSIPASPLKTDRPTNQPAGSSLNTSMLLGSIVLSESIVQCTQGGLGAAGSLTLNSLAPGEPLHVWSHVSYSQWGAKGNTDQG